MNKFQKAAGIVALMAAASTPLVWQNYDRLFKSYYTRPYTVEDISTGKVTNEGTIYVDNSGDKLIEYNDKGSDGTIDEKKVYQKGKGWDLGKNTQLESLILTDNKDLTRLRVPREEWNAIMQDVITNWDRCILKDSDEGKKLQDEFDAVKKATK